MVVAAALIIGVVLGVVGALLIRRPGPAGDPAGEIDRRSAADRPRPATRSADDGVVEILQVAADQLELAVMIAGRDGRIRFRNRAATELQGTHVGVLVESAIDEVVARSWTDGRVERSVDVHGPPRATLEIRAEPVRDDAAVVLLQDVSERERIAAMRTDFVANISHELKTPVGAIAVLADALLGESDPDVVTRVAGRIVEESDRAVTTIDDLLELSRIESARLDDEVVDVHDVVQAALARGRTVDVDKHVRLSAFDARSSILIHGDRRQLVSAVGNLVENAVKYSDPDSVVQVRTRRDDRWIEIMVADQGVGIPPRDLDRVFERFYRVDRARSRSTGGSGLGLSIVRHVVTNHGGDVQVSSTEGEGSTFVLRLPVSLVVEEAPEPSTDGVTEVIAASASITDDDEPADVLAAERESDRSDEETVNHE
ncbi:MAG: ATP-binding protein [Actinomycetota bacterium]